MTGQAKQREQGVGSQYRKTAPVPLSRPLWDDDGATWKGGLLLDERESSYPDGIQAEDGTLFIIYDHQRYTLNRAGKPVTDEVRLQRVVTQLQNTDDKSGAPPK